MVDGTASSCNDTVERDPGNLINLIDSELLAEVRVDHRGLDNRPHVTPEQVDRIAADLIPAARWAGGGP
jgi:hypothetical protein